LAMDAWSFAAVTSSILLQSVSVFAVRDTL
jgi:hypothetical protein